MAIKVAGEKPPVPAGTGMNLRYVDYVIRLSLPLLSIGNCSLFVDGGFADALLCRMKCQWRMEECMCFDVSMFRWFETVKSDDAHKKRTNVFCIPPGWNFNTDSSTFYGRVNVREV